MPREGSRIFAGYRALGFTSNHVPLCVRYHRRHGENYAITCCGRTFHTYKCSNLGIVSVSNSLKDPISCLATDNRFVYTACGNVINAFNRGRQVAHTYVGHYSDIHILLPFGFHLISVDRSSAVKVWDNESEDVYLELKFDSASFEVSSVVHPMTYMNKVVFGSRQGSLQLWNLRTNKLVYTFQGWSSAVLVLEQSPVEHVIAVGLEDGRIIVHNIQCDETLMTFKQDWGPVTAIAFRTDGQPIMASGSHVGHIALWNLEQRRLQSQIRHAHYGAVTGMKCLPSEPLMVTSADDNSIKVWIFDEADGGGRVLRERSGHSAPPHRIRFHGSNGEMILSAGQDSTLRCFSTVHDSANKSMGRASYNKVKTKKSGLKADEHMMPPVIDFSSEVSRQSDWDGILACHRGEKVVTTWNYNRGTMGAHKLTHPRFDDSKLHRLTVANCVCVTACGNFGLVGYSSGHVDIYNMQSGLHRGCYGNDKAHDGSVLGVNVDVFNQWTVTVGSDRCVKFWDFKTKQLIDTLKMDSIVARSIMHRESFLFALALDDFRVVVVDVRTRNVIRMFSGHTNTVTDMAFNADARWLITSSLDSTVRTWDLPSGKLVDCFLVESPVTSLTFSPTDTYLATTHIDDLGVYLWTNLVLCGATLSSLPSDYTPSGTTSLPSTGQQNKDCEAMEEDEVTPRNFESAKQIDPDFATLSKLPSSRWKHLLDIDIIRQRNKPKEAPRVPKLAPFFLPTVAGLEPKFLPPIDGGKTNEKSKIWTGLRDSLSELGRLLELSQTTHDYGSVMEYLKTLMPTAIEAELTALAPTNGGSVQLIGNFIDVIVHVLNSRTDVELAGAYLALFLKLHGDLLIESFAPELDRLCSANASSWDNVSALANRVTCVSDYVRGAAI